MSLYAAAVTQPLKMLENLDRWIDKTVAYAKAKSFDPNVLVQARLAPDMYPFVRQVQSSCDGAKFTASRLAGKEAPAHPDTETTVDELKARIQAVIAFLRTFTEADFVGAETRVVALPFLPGKGVVGAAYLTELAQPNFYFHITMAYAILRHNGSDVGKYDYLGSLPLLDL